MIACCMSWAVCGRQGSSAGEIGTLEAFSKVVNGAARIGGRAGGDGLW